MDSYFITLAAFVVIMIGYIVLLERRLKLRSRQWHGINSMLQFMSEKFAQSEEEKRELKRKLETFETLENPEDNEDQ